MSGRREINQRISQSIRLRWRLVKQRNPDAKQLNDVTPEEMREIDKEAGTEKIFNAIFEER